MSERPKRWRRTKRVLVVVFVLALVVRASLPWAVGAIARSQASASGLELTLGDVDLSLHEGRASVWNVMVTRANERVLAIESIDVDLQLGALFTGALVVRRAEIDGVDLRLTRGADGVIEEFAGLVSNAAAEEATGERSADTGPIVIDSLALPIAIRAARVQRVRIEWSDAAVTPPVELRAELDLAASDIGVAGRDGRVELRFAAPGAIGQLSADATLRLEREHARIDGDVLVTGVEGEAIAAYLAALGIAPPERSQELRLAAEADVRLVGPNRFEGAARLEQSIGRPTGTGTSWLQLSEVAASFVPTADGTDVELLVKGLALEAERAKDGRIVVAGFAIGTSAGTDDAGAAGSAPTTTAVASEPSRALPIRIASARAEELALVLVDRALGAEALRLELAIESAVATIDGANARVDVALALPGVVERATLALTADLFALRGRADVALTGLTGERIAAYLAPLGVVPSGAAGDLALGLAFDGSSGALDVVVDTLALTSGANTPLALERAELRGLSSRGFALAEVTALRLAAVSRSNGTVEFGPLLVTTAGPAPVAAPAPAPTATGADAANAPIAPTAPNEGSVPVPGESRPVAATFDARVAGLDLSSGSPADVRVVFAAPGLVDRVALEGTVAATRASVDARLALAVTALRLDALAARRPDAAAAAQDLALALEARVEPHRSGGHDLEVTVRDLAAGELVAWSSLRVSAHALGSSISGDVELVGAKVGALGATDLSATLGFEAASNTNGGGRVVVSDLALGDAATRVVVPTIEIDVPRASATELDIARVAATGIEVDALQRADGAFAVAGLVFAPRDEAALSAAASAPAAVPVGAASATSASASAGTAPSATTPTAAPFTARTTIGELVFDVARFTLRDEARDTSALATLRIATRSPAVWFDPNTASTPLVLELAARLAPGIESLAGELSLAPDATGVGLDVRLAIDGIDDTGLVAALPQFGGVLAPGGVASGSFRVTAHARLDAPRRGAFDFDLRRAGGAALDVTGLEFTPVAAAAPTIGVAELRARLAPFGASDAPLRVTLFEIDDVLAAVERTADGLSIGGLVVRSPAPEPAPEPAVATEAAPATNDSLASTSTAATPTDASVPNTGGRGLLVDRFVWSGLQLSLIDSTVAPPTRLPIDAFELDVRDVALGTPARRPVQVRLALGGGDVELPDLPKDGPFIANLARELVGAAERTSSLRPWLDEVVIAAQVLPGASPEGWVRTELYGFELTALQGLAEASGVKIGAGTVDANLRLDLRGTRGVRVDNRTTFTSLSISEPANGPISRFLKLPAPLDVVLWALENERSEHVVPLEFSIDHSGVSAGELAATGSKALVLLIADALASSPLRIGGGVLDLVGLDLGGLNPFGSNDTKSAVAIEVPFASGATALDAAGSDAVTQVLTVLAKDPNAVLRIAHRYSADDLELAAQLALPDPLEIRRLAVGLETERAGLVAQLALDRDALARLVATGAVAEVAAAQAGLRANAERLLGLEQSLDTLHELSTEADERTRTKRLREAALRLAERRFEAFVRDLVARGAQDALARLQLVRPRLADVAQDGAGAALVVSRRER